MIFVRGVSLSTLREELHQKYGIFPIESPVLPYTDID